jgi:hypothetical protein
LFAIPEILDLVVSDRPIARKALDLEKVQADIRSQRVEGIRETFRHKFLVLRASLIGLFVGMMPGVGGSVAHWLAYAQARQTEKGAFKTFGTGDIRGVIAPESANNSIDAGVLMPTVAFGIPGSGQMSIFLGFLILLGLQPGPAMLNQHLHLTLLMAWSLAVANVIATVVALYYTPQLARIAAMNPNVLAPIVLAMLFLSGFQSNRSMGDLVLMCLLFAVGWFMKRYGWPRVPIILGLVLAEPLEKYMWLSLNTYGVTMLARPQVWIIFALALSSLLLSLRAQRATRSIDIASSVTSANERSAPEPRQGENSCDAPASGVLRRDASKAKRISLTTTLEALFLAANSALFIYFIVAARNWPLSSALLPRLVGAAGLVCLACFLIQKVIRAARGVTEGRILDIGFRYSDLTRDEITRRILRVVGSMAALLAGVWLVGFHITIPLYLLVYCTVFGAMQWRNAFLIAAGFEVFIVGVYDMLVHVIWNEPLLLKLAAVVELPMFR